MPYIDNEIILKAKKMDLLTYLRSYEPSELVHVSGEIYSTVTHDSLIISNGMWCWNSHSIGGKSALDYLIKVRDIPFMEAVKMIAGQTAARPIELVTPKQKPKVPNEFKLPKAAHSDENVIVYLRSRGIDRAIVMHCMQNKLIYESYSNHNAVFVGYDSSGKAKYGNLRGTSGFAFKGEVQGSDKRYSFSLKAVVPNSTVNFFESAIDALSYASLLKIQGLDWQNKNLISLAGVFRPKQNGESALPLSLQQYLNDNPITKKIVLRLDNDEGGRLASKAIRAALFDRYEIEEKPAPTGKDFNEYLCKTLELPIRHDKPITKKPKQSENENR
ncbi:MAG: DUF3991 and TOPRIM domain-containing protein [Ruthenibacterium sp.]